ncbi:MAG TPA: superoxide dismutase family protein, partial [Prolixibacteraceae bacterium]|nr:superoxide dismutase family protein [Prolixibacteraceae bacterium]
GPEANVRHIGDMGNLEAGNDGKAHMEYTDKMLSLTGSNSIVGRGIIVHAGEDDLTSQPTGAAGARVACGVIGIGNSSN